MIQRIEIPELSEAELLRYLSEEFRRNATQKQVFNMDQADSIFLSLIERLKVEQFSHENEIRLLLKSLPNYKLTSELFELVIINNPRLLKYIHCFQGKIWIYQPNKNELDILSEILKKNGSLYRYLSAQYQNSLPLLSIVLSQENCRNSHDIIACIPVEALQLQILALTKIFPDLDEKIENNRNRALAYSHLKNTFDFQLLVFNPQLKWLLIIEWLISFGVLGLVSLIYAAAVATAMVTPIFLFWIAMALLATLVAVIPIIAELYYIEPLSRAVETAECIVGSTLRKYGIFNETRPPISGLEQDFSDISEEFRALAQEEKMKTVRLSIFNGTRLSWKSIESDPIDFSSASSQVDTINMS